MGAERKVICQGWKRLLEKCTLIEIRALQRTPYPRNSKHRAFHAIQQLRIGWHRLHHVNSGCISLIGAITLKRLNTERD